MSTSNKPSLYFLCHGGEHLDRLAFTLRDVIPSAGSVADVLSIDRKVQVTIRRVEAFLGIEFNTTSSLWLDCSKPPQAER